MKTALDFMNIAFDLALKGWGKVSPNPMVGAVLVKSGKVISKGYHAEFGAPHAEAMAIASAGVKAKGSDLYVTLEPCSHFGKTPPCTQAIINAGIKKVYVGVLDPNPLMNGKSVKLLRKEGIDAEVGFLQNDLQSINEGFNAFISTGKPFVTAKIAQTLDGKIANAFGKSKWITSQESRGFAHELRYGFDAILVGINTVLKDNPSLNSIPHKRIKKIILDTHLKMPTKGNIYLSTSPEDIFIFTAAKENKKLKATIIQAPLKNGMIDLDWVMAYLGKIGIANLLIEGGPAVLGNALRHGLVDKMTIYVAPKFMGDGLNSVTGFKTTDIAKMMKLKDISVGRIGEDIFIEGYL